MKNQTSLSSFYKKFYYKAASILKWPIFVLILIVLGTSLLILFSDQTTNSKYRIYAVETESMEPTLMVGDMILIERDDNGYSVDEIISFKYRPEEKKPITHRIIEIDRENIQPITTKGDNNDTNDAYPITENQILGKVIHTAPNIGSAIIFMRSVEGIIILYIIPITILLTLNVQSIYKWLGDYDKNDKKEKKRSDK